VAAALALSAVRRAARDVVQAGAQRRRQVAKAATVLALSVILPGAGGGARVERKPR
jgi:hypothetical protein